MEAENVADRAGGIDAVDAANGDDAAAKVPEARILNGHGVVGGTGADRQAGAGEAGIRDGHHVVAAATAADGNQAVGDAGLIHAATNEIEVADGTGGIPDRDIATEQLRAVRHAEDVADRRGNIAHPDAPAVDEHSARIRQPNRVAGC